MFELNGIFKDYKEDKLKNKYSGFRTFGMIVGFVLFPIFTETMTIKFTEKFMEKYILDMDKILLFQLVYTILPILYVIFFSKVLFKHKFKNLGFSKENFVRYYSLGTLIGLIMFSTCVLIGVILGFQRIVLNPEKISYFMIFLFLIGFLIQGMSEEVVLRGWLFSELSYKFGIVAGIILNSLIFSLMHSGNPNITLIAYLNIFLFGAFESLVYYKWQNLWICGAIHSLWNFSQGNIFGIQVSGISFSKIKIFEIKFLSHSNFTGGIFGTEGGLICTFVLILFSIAILYIIKNDRKSRNLKSN